MKRWVLGGGLVVAVASWLVAGGLSHSSRTAPREVAASERMLQAAPLPRSTPAAARARPRETYARLPLAFVPSEPGSRTRYVAQGGGYSFAFTPTQALFSFTKGERGLTLGLRFVGGSPRAIDARGKLPGVVNDLRGSDPARWRTSIPTFSTLVYRELWRGIDLRLRGAPGRLKYEFVVRPGARLSDIRLAYRGASGLRLARDGALHVGTPLGAIRDSPPLSYQLVDGRRVAVPSRYALAGTHAYGFTTSAYDPARTLVIDPGLEYSTFLGGAGDEFVNAIAVDQRGDAFITGRAPAPDYPTTPGALDRSSTLLGGTSDDHGRAIAVGKQGNAYVAGNTTSADFPTTAGAFNRAYAGAPDEGAGDGFVAKLDRSGSALVYSTFLGGQGFDDVSGGIAVDVKGGAFVFGTTDSPDFPTTPGAFDQTLNVDVFGYGDDAFVAKLSPTGSSLVFSTFLGGTGPESTLNGRRIGVDNRGNAYVTGETGSPDFPVTAGAFDGDRSGGRDVYVTKLSRDGSALVYSTLLGGSSFERSRGIAVDKQGNAYVTGQSTSSDYPVTPGAFAGGGPGFGFRIFATKVDRTGSALAYSTVLGVGSGRGIAVDKRGSAVVTGAAGVDFPTTAGAFDRTFDGFNDGFVAKLDRAGSTLLYSTFLGGTEDTDPEDEIVGFDQPNAVAVDGKGDAYVTGLTNSPDFPTTATAFDTTYNGGGDVFVTKLGLGNVTD